MIPFPKIKDSTTPRVHVVGGDLSAHVSWGSVKWLHHFGKGKSAPTVCCLIPLRHLPRTDEKICAQNQALCSLSPKTMTTTCPPGGKQIFRRWQITQWTPLSDTKERAAEPTGRRRAPAPSAWLLWRPCGLKSPRFGLHSSAMMDCLYVSPGRLRGGPQGCPGAAPGPVDVIYVEEGLCGRD